MKDNFEWSKNVKGNKFKVSPDNRLGHSEIRTLNLKGIDTYSEKN